MSETSNTLPRVMLALSSAGACVFRQNTGTAWAGSGKPYRAPRAMQVSLQQGDAVLRGPVRPLQAGLAKGSSDIIGWRSVRITPEMVNMDVAVFVAVEVKNKRGRATAEQRNFIERVREAGGIAGVARDESDAESLLDRFPHT